MAGHVYFVGAGPGDPELLTVKARRLLGEADRVLYADSLVHPGILALARADALLIPTASSTLEAIVAAMVEGVRRGETVVRLASGDPTIFGALAEQMASLHALGIPFTVVPGVSSVSAAAAALKVELTLPGVAQTVVLSRVPRRTERPPGESLARTGSGGGTVALFLSATTAAQAVKELEEAGFSPGTPAAVCYRVSWEDERLIRTSLEDVPHVLREERLHRQVLILVGKALGGFAGDGAPRSRLYHPEHRHLYRHGAGGGL